MSDLALTIGDQRGNDINHYFLDDIRFNTASKLTEETIVPGRFFFLQKNQISLVFQLQDLSVTPSHPHCTMLFLRTGLRSQSQAATGHWLLPDWK